MSDLNTHLLTLRAAGSGAAFEADFAMASSSTVARQIGLAQARDHLLQGLHAIDAALACLDREPATPNGDPE